MRASVCMVLSVLLHAAVIGVLLTRAPLWAADAPAAEPPAWLHAVAQPPPVPVEPLPPPKPPPPAPPRKIAEPRPVRAPRFAPNPNATGIPDGKGTLAMGAEGDGTVAKSSEDVAGDGPPSEPVPPGPLPGTRRTHGPAKLSIWIDRRAFDRAVLVRPGLAIVMSVPGLRDMLRGSNIRPFFDLERLRITLSDASPERLVVAGVHADGEQAMRDAAARIAAMRRQEPVWRGDSTLRATSWVDGSGLDRGLAMHAGAFLIGARESLPAVLGDARSEDRIESLSRMRKRVMFVVSIEAAARYLPILARCSLQGLHVSIASTPADTQRMSLRADYETATAAGVAPECLQTLGKRIEPLSRIAGWLAQASSEPGSFSTQLNVGVTNAEIQSLLDELAWTLRSAGRS